MVGPEMFCFLSSKMGTHIGVASRSLFLMSSEIL